MKVKEKPCAFLAIHFFCLIGDFPGITSKISGRAYIYNVSEKSHLYFASHKKNTDTLSNVLFAVLLFL